MATQKIDVVTRPRKEVEVLIQHLQLDIEDGVIDMGEVKLVLNKKQDAYYTVKRDACSCPDYIFRGARNGAKCKHMALFQEQPKPHEDARLAAAHSLRDSINESQGPVFVRAKARGVA